MEQSTYIYHRVNLWHMKMIDFAWKIPKLKMSFIVYKILRPL
jgi:hypothetical protein